MMKDILQVIAGGQCGSRLGQDFEQLGVNACYINSDEVDMRGMLVDPKKLLLLETTGTGGSPTKGREMVDKNWDKVMRFVGSNVDPSKMILLVAGLGGGTGSSVILALAEHFTKGGNKVGVLATLPPRMLGILASDNSLKTLKQLKELKINLFVLADNEFLIEKIGLGNIWWDKVNKRIVSEFRSGFDLLGTGKITTTGLGSIDKGEIMRILQSGNGMTDIRTVYLNSMDMKLEDKELTKKIFEPSLIEGYGYKTTLAYLVGIDIPKGKNLTNEAKRIFDLTKKVSGSAISRLGMFVDPMLSDVVRVTMINAGMKLPRILQSRVNNLKRDEERFKEKKSKEEVINLGDLESGIISEEFDI